MTTPTHRRNPAVFEALKLAKLLEIYTIKKVCNEKNFSRKNTEDSCLWNCKTNQKIAIQI